MEENKDIQQPKKKERNINESSNEKNHSLTKTIDSLSAELEGVKA